MNTKVLASLLVLPLLAACSPQLTSTLNLTDLEKVAQSGIALSTPATLLIPEPSEDDCSKGLGELVAKFQTIANITDGGKCIDQGGDEYAQLQTSVAIVSADAKLGPKDLFVVEVGKPDGQNNIPLTFVMQKTVKEIQVVVSPDSTDTDFDPAQFIFQLNNDGTDTATVTPAEVFIENDPHPANGGPITIDASAQVDIKLSDVASALTEDGKPYVFAILAGK
jgi:hypothetical protein